MNEQDQELFAMATVVQALTPLDDEARKRVLNYALARFKSSGMASEIEDASNHAENTRNNTASASAAERITGHDTLAELYHEAKPNSDAEKALTVSAWFQASEGREGIDSFSVNTALKNLGYPIGNITRALDVLVNQRPALMIQLRKSGTTKQARKLFKVTDAGIKRVTDLLNTSET